jgi:PRTRC genetic system protein A
MKPVGYLANTKLGQEGNPGLFYNYVLAKNGLFIQAGNSLLRATIRIAEVEVRGLMPMVESVELVKGKIPLYIHDLAIGALCADPEHEIYLAIRWEGNYRLKAPNQTPEPGAVTYEVQDSVILDVHSHGRGLAFFSFIDNADEQGLKLYMVVGEVHTLMPTMLMRIGVYGYFKPLGMEEVFGV